jgi:hypothetical protein
MECIDRDNITKKVRNIQGANTVAAGLAQMIQSPVTMFKEKIDAENIKTIFCNPKEEPDY